MKCRVDPYELAASFIDKSKHSAIQQQKETLIAEEAFRCISETAEKCAMVSGDASIDEIVEAINGIKEQIDNVLHNINPNHIANSVKNMLNAPYSRGLAKNTRIKSHHIGAWWNYSPLERRYLSTRCAS